MQTNQLILMGNKKQKMKTIKLEFINLEDSITLFKALNKNLGLNFVDCKKLLRKKDVKIDGVRVTSDCLLKNNQVITCYITPSFDVVYEDENILLINKPKHIETISNSSNNSLTHQLKQIYSYCEPCNRLDTNTTGINVFALNNESEEEIKQAFKEDRVTKKYLAVVSGEVKNEDFLKDYLVKNANNSKVKIYSQKVKDGVEITTEYRLLKQLNQELSLIEVTLHTGKTHQIRAHLSFHNIYILGDEKYGNIEINKKYKRHTQFLISYYIAFDFLDSNKLNYLCNRQFVLNIETEDFKL